MVNLPGSIAEFERELMLERQRERITAKAEGKIPGAPAHRPQEERRRAEAAC
jgi:DNA invertase Pin-like site-specific DNA recombinase